MSTFDPANFANIVITEANDTERLPVPEGEYTALVEKQEINSWKSRTDPTKQGLRLDVTWSIEDDNVKTLMSRSKVTIKQGIMLELDDSGALAMGKGMNADLGRLRTALGLNTPGEPFTWAQLEGRPGKVSVKHRLDGDKLYAEVKAVAKL